AAARLDDENRPTTLDRSDGGAGGTCHGRHLANVVTSQLRKRDKTFDSAFALSREVFDIGALSLPELARRTWREVMDDDVLGLAAQLSYYFFLALFPAI